MIPELFLLMLAGFAGDSVSAGADNGGGLGSSGTGGVLAMEFKSQP